MDIKRAIKAIIIACLLSFLITSIFYRSDIKSEWKEWRDGREIINLLREDSPYLAHGWMIGEGLEVTRLAIEDVNILIEYEPVYYVSKGITFSFSIENEGKNSLSKKEIKLLLGYIYLIHDEKVISSLEPSYIVNVEKMLDGEYKYYLALTPDDIGKWRLLILCTYKSTPPYDYLGKKIEWEEQIFEVSLSEPPTFPILSIFGWFIGLLGIFGTIIHHYLYPKLEQFLGRKVFYIIIFHLVFLLLLVYFFIL